MQHDEIGLCTARAALAKDLESSSEGAALLARTLCAYCETRSPDSLVDLESAVRSYAAEFRRSEKPPEQLVVALKRLFERIDGHAPSLVTLQAIRVPSTDHPGCCALYQTTLARCIDAYFAELFPEPPG
jgi:hypothetical protein